MLDEEGAIRPGQIADRTNGLHDTRSMHDSSWGGDVESGDKALVILQTMICYLREKNILSRADIEVLRERVEARIDETRTANLPCDATIAEAAAREMRDLDEYCGKRYGGKHRRKVN